MKRLETIASFISPYRIIADVGCDHGYLIEIAFKNKLIDKAYAIDNKEGPLNQAINNLSGFSNVEFILQDGIISLNKDCECVIIAGMGGMLVNNIINSGIKNLKNVKRVVVEANKDSDKVRINMYNHGYKIIKEEIVFEDNKYYEIDSFEKNDGMIYNQDELFFGPFLINNKPKEFVDKWNKQINKYKELNVKQEFVNRVERILK